VIDKILGVRQNLAKRLSEEFADADLTVDEKTGAIIFNSSLLFELAKSDLNSEGKAFLDEFFPRYLGILLGDEFLPYIAEINIEGHADSSGSYMYNMELSQERALTVARYLLADSAEVLSPEEQEQFRQIVTATGRSWSELIYNEDGTENPDASRRVEIQIRMKDPEMIEEMGLALTGGAE
jgi:chemotaxis protein MotB